MRPAVTRSVRVFAKHPTELLNHYPPRQSVKGPRYKYFEKKPASLLALVYVGEQELHFTGGQVYLDLP